MKFGRFNLFSTAGLAVMLVAGLLLGFGAGWLAPHGSTPGDHSAEAGFARDMSSHHAQAVQMGLIAARKATDPAVRILGADIAMTQQGQIGIMTQWLRDWRLNSNSFDQPMAWMPDGKNALENGLMPGMATSAEIASLESASGVEVDRQFLKLMINHHLGGVHMVDGVLKLSHDADVVWLAEAMKAGQQREITSLQELQRSIG